MAPRLLIAPSEIHRLRFVKNKVLGMSIEQLAKEEGVQEKFIQQSIARVEAYRSLNTLEELEASQTEVVIFNKEVEKLAIHESLKATVEVRNSEGELISTTPDHETRLKAVEVLTKIAGNLIDSKYKGSQPGPTTNVNILNAPAGGVGIATFEDRLREVKAKRVQREQLNLPAAVSEEEIEEITPDWEGDVVEQSSP